MWLALSDRLLNPALGERLSWLAEADNRNSLGLAIAVGAAAVVVWDLVDTGPEDPPADDRVSDTDPTARRVPRAGPSPVVVTTAARPVGGPGGRRGIVPG